MKNIFFLLFWQEEEENLMKIKNHPSEKEKKNIFLDSFFFFWQEEEENFKFFWRTYPFREEEKNILKLFCYSQTKNSLNEIILLLNKIEKYKNLLLLWENFFLILLSENRRRRKFLQLIVGTHFRKEEFVLDILSTFLKLFFPRIEEENLRN